MLTLVAPLQTSPTRQRIQVYLWSGMVFVLFSVLVSFFRLKNRGTISFTTDCLTWSNTVEIRVPFQTSPVIILESMRR